MRDLMRGSLARSLSTFTEEDRLAAALPLVCGTALASHCEIDRLDAARMLHIRVRGRDWMGPLLSMREVLRSDLARTAGVILADLRFQVAGARESNGRNAGNGNQPPNGRGRRNERDDAG